MTLKCPKCNSIIYSKLATICSECHAPLPKEYLPTEEELAKRKIADQNTKKILRQEDVETDQRREEEFKATGKNIFRWISS
jgi:hypothetical protein